MFYVGQRVVCIDDRFDPSIVAWADHLPRAGEIYTVRSCKNAPDHATGVSGPSFKLLEIANPRTEQGGEVTFSSERFEPIGDAFMEGGGGGQLSANLRAARWPGRWAELFAFWIAQSVRSACRSGCRPDRDELWFARETLSLSSCGWREPIGGARNRPSRSC